MTPTALSEGDWVYVKPDWAGPFTAYDRRTGITHDTGATSIQDARAWVQAFNATDATDATDQRRAPRYTLATTGPSRARAGDQRYWGGEERTV